ncbi:MULTISPECIES: ABC transporter substrate-binding protein [Paenibacillus]|uniref:ABC transporter substrate-binding protein n=1 Tax=Paenibacillus oleatilyticus TaxID=2594886 RepID=A0ABV4V0M2_9BACL|nr:ABC transporter substrate-binding protein [Paenibacillus tyrfis]GLI06843.1 ABC transporter substrate-binding protein [Paenibacillus tyrfis]
MKKWMLLLLVFALVVSVFGCSNSAGSDGKTEARKSDDGKIKVTFWHAMSGDLGKHVQTIVDKYNASQNKVKVEAVFQGSYEEALTKLKSVGGTAEAPTIVQVNEVGTKYMIDSGFIQPVQDFMDKEKYDISQLEPGILSYYQVDGKLYSLPFNASNAVLFYNKDKFKAAGLNPEQPPKTFGEIREAAKKLSKGDEKGFAILIYGWFIEQLLANQGADFVDQGNGRSGTPTKSLINGPEGLAIFKWLDDMNKDGSLGNYGRKWDDILAAFQAGKVAMYLDTTGDTTYNVQNAPFQVGTGYLPVPDGKQPQGVVIGGASLWMMKSVAQEEKDAAWDFMKFVAKPETQAEWASNTGYFPITKAAYDQKTLKDTYAKYPQFLTAVDQLHNSKSSTATQGALISVFPEARLEVATSIEKLYGGQDPQSIVDALAGKINKLLEESNKVNAKK